MAVAVPGGNFGRSTKWPKVVEKAGLPPVSTSTICGTPGTSTNSGATTRELMHRMGHGSMRAALIYQHATADGDRSIADALSELVDLGRTDDSARTRKRTATTARLECWCRWRNSTLIARPATVVLLMIGKDRRLHWWRCGAGDRDRTGMASLEGCAHYAVRGLDQWSGRVTGPR
jgi:hypothetical protein